jgi:hypothetical protein
MTMNPDPTPDPSDPPGKVRFGAAGGEAYCDDVDLVMAVRQTVRDLQQLLTKLDELLGNEGPAESPPVAKTKTKAKGKRAKKKK